MTQELGQAGAEIEVTPEMIDAGAEYLACRLVDGEDAEQAAKEVFAEMLRARRSQSA